MFSPHARPHARGAIESGSRPNEGMMEILLFFFFLFCSVTRSRILFLSGYRDMTSVFGPTLFPRRSPSLVQNRPSLVRSLSHSLPRTLPLVLPAVSPLFGFPSPALASRGTQQGPVVYLNGYWVARPAVSRPNKPKLTQSHASRAPRRVRRKDPKRRAKKRADILSSRTIAVSASYIRTSWYCVRLVCLLARSLSRSGCRIAILVISVVAACNGGNPTSLREYLTLASLLPPCSPPLASSSFSSSTPARPRGRSRCRATFPSLPSIVVMQRYDATSVLFQ